MAKTGRNDLCPCGSGKKYKRCHESKERGDTTRSRMMMIVVGGAVLAALAVGIMNFTGERSTTSRVWSAEHGHYHDASGMEIP